MRMHARYAVVAIASLLTVIGMFAPGVSAEEKERTSCRTPLRFGEFSDWSKPVNLGPVVNSPFDDRHPAISPNGLSLYITSNRPGGFGPERTWNIWVSQRASLHDPWGPPRNLGPNINTPGGFAPNFSPDGHWLFFTGGPVCPGGIPSPGNIWVSHRKDTDDDFAWEPAVDLGPEINDPGCDSLAPTFFRDEETGITSIYLTSQFRPDRPGNFHIYASTQREDADDRGFVGTFGLPVLVPELSSPRRDTRTAIRHDGLEMFITSNRAGSVPDSAGQPSLDLWVSTRASTRDPWSAPVNSGPTVNTPAAEGGPALSCDGTTLYFYSTRPGGVGAEDLYVTTRTELCGDQDDGEGRGRHHACKKDDD
jgi:hypothetical protein